MRKYLSTLHQRPDHHKRRFALLTSGAITLFIFTVWSFVNFGTLGTESQAVALSETNEVSPFQSLRESLASSFEAFRDTAVEIKDVLKTVDIEVKYGEMKEGALDTYGQ